MAPFLFLALFVFIPLAIQFHRNIKIAPALSIFNLFHYFQHLHCPLIFI